MYESLVVVNPLSSVGSRLLSAYAPAPPRVRTRLIQLGLAAFPTALTVSSLGIISAWPCAMQKLSAHFPSALLPPKTRAPAVQTQLELIISTRYSAVKPAGSAKNTR